MANKAAAKASAAWAARAKKDGFPIRRTFRCHCGAMIAMTQAGRHNCSGRAFNSFNGLPTVEKPMFKMSLNQITERAMKNVSKRSDREKELVRQADRSMNFPATLPRGWRSSLWTV